MDCLKTPAENLDKENTSMETFEMVQGVIRKEDCLNNNNSGIVDKQCRASEVGNPTSNTTSEQEAFPR